MPFAVVELTEDTVGGVTSFVAPGVAVCATNPPVPSGVRERVSVALLLFAFSSYNETPPNVALKTASSVLP